MDASTRSVQEHVAAVVPAKRRRDAETLIAMMGEITGREPVLWSGGIIGFGSYHYRYPTGTEGDAPLAGFAARKTSSTVYVDRVADYAEALADLGPHTSSVVCLYIPDLEKVDLDVLRSVVTASFRRVVDDALPGVEATVTG